MERRREAELLCYYLVNRPLSDEAAMLFARASELHPVFLSAAEQKAWNHCLKHPSMITFIDAALAIRKTNSGIRRKIFLMFAVLESLPEYHTCFLPSSRSPFYPVYIFFRGVLATMKSIIGQIILWIL
jgi:hypothetical protein